jgi:hypothetical protein
MNLIYQLRTHPHWCLHRELPFVLKITSDLFLGRISLYMYAGLDLLVDSPRSLDANNFDRASWRCNSFSIFLTLSSMHDLIKRFLLRSDVFLTETSL